MSIVTNLDAITSSAKTKEYTVEEKRMITHARQLINTRIPDCALVARGACQGPIEEYCPGYNYFTSPYLIKSELDITLYMGIFEEISNAGSISSLALTGTVENTRAAFVKKIIFQACLPHVDILSSDSHVVTEGPNFNIYMDWARASDRFYAALLECIDNKKVVNMTELEKLYLGGIEPINGDENSRIAALTAQITEARAALMDKEAEVKLTGGRSLVLKTIAQTLKYFENTNKDGKSNMAWIKGALDTFNYIAGQNKIFDALIRCFLKVNNENNDAFDIGNDSDKARNLVKAMYRIDVNKGKVIVSPAVIKFKEGKNLGIRHLFYYLFDR